MPEQLALTAPITTISAAVSIPQGSANDPLAIEIDGMASAAVRWNGVLIGGNGVPGPDRASEKPGLFSFSVAVPRSLVRPGENRVTLTFSAHYLWLPVSQPLRRLEVGRPSEPVAYTLWHYLPTLTTLAVPIAAVLLLSALLLTRRLSRPFLLPTTILGVISVQGLIEVSKVVFSYTYPWHLARLVVLTSLTASVALLLVVLTCRIHPPLRTRLVVASTATTMLIACTVVPGLDRKALAILEIALFVAAAVATPAAVQREWQAIALAATAVLVAVWAHHAGPNFLDVGYYLTAAGAGVGIGVRAVLQTKQVLGLPDTVIATEPTVMLRDGTRHHVLRPSQVVFVKAADDYCTVHMVGGREIMVTMTLKAVLDLMPADFLRIHRSHAINARNLSGTRRGRNGRVAELVDGTVLAVGRTYSADVFSLMAENG